MVKIVKLITCMLIMSLLAVPVFAEEKTQAELLQEMMMNGDTGDNSEAIPEPNFEPVEDPVNNDVIEEPVYDVEPVYEEPSDPNETAIIIELVNRIDALSTKNPDEEEVEELEKMYNSLSASNKINVTNYDILAKAIAKVEKKQKKEEEVTEEPVLDEIQPTQKQKTVRDDPDVVNKTTEYLVTIKEPITIVSRFLVDDNYDGLIDIPSYSILGPGGYSYIVDSTKLQIKDDGLDMICTWVDREYVQFDIQYAEEGQWQFTSTLPCTFEKMAYVERYEIPEPIPTQSENDQNTPMPAPSFNSALIIGIIILLGILLMVAVILVMNKVDILSPVMNPIRNIVGAGGKDNSKGKYMNDDDDYGASLTDEQIMAQIKKEYEEQKAKEEKMQEEARQEQVQEKYEKENEMNDDRIYETRFDYDDEEEAIEEEDLEIDDTENENTETKKPRRFT